MRVHFIAIGGSAMHNLALALNENGSQVTGSDDVIFEPSKSRLKQACLLPKTIGWNPDRITEDLDMVILGMHAKADNPELLKAKELGLKVVSYPEFLYEHAKDKTRVVIGGSHGKTSITSMILHVMRYWDKEVDYMVGAQLDGFDTMVHLTDSNDFIVLEGDEYLSSALDRNPKFHIYKPNIALLSGIAWDHVNVFPTFEKYVEQFKIFLDKITSGGSVIYNAEDEVLSKTVLASENTIKKYPYKTPKHEIKEGQTLLDTPEGLMPIEIFGKHNLQNLEGARWICQLMGVDELNFYEAIASFTGASKRLEKIYDSPKTKVYKDYAHSPSKVEATTAAVKEQYPDKKLIACLELHTYSSLTPSFLKEYQNTLNPADEAIVFYSPDAVAIKGLNPISKEQIVESFNREALKVFTEPSELEIYLKEKDLSDSVLLLMSSGNYGGLPIDTIASIL